MRVGQDGFTVPSTLGEYRDLCVLIGGEDCRAVKALDAKIAANPQGRAAQTLKDDAQISAVLIPLLTNGNSTTVS